MRFNDGISTKTEEARELRGRDELTASHREWLIRELRAGPRARRRIADAEASAMKTLFGRL
jgi:hypothetical protein